MSAVNVENHLLGKMSLIVIREFTLVKSLMCAVNVESPLPVEVASVTIRWEFTLEKGLLNAANVGNHLPGTVTCVVIREFT